MTVGRSGWAATGTAAIYLFAAMVAIFFASLTRDSAFVGGDYIPATNDSFYHARRILVTVESTADFYEYDTRLQVPEGTWIPWPWGYDYLLAKVVRAGAGLSSALDASTILAYFPVA